MKPECLYASECLAMNYNLDKLEILERRIVRKILGLPETSEGWKLRSNDEICKSIENVTETVRKRRLVFFEHLYKMNDNMLTKQIFKYLCGKKSTSSWIKEVQKDLEKYNLHAKEATEREVFWAKMLKGRSSE